MMIEMQDIHSLTDFTRHTKAFVRRLKKTGRPAVLTVNGHAEFVVQEAASYQNLLNLALRAQNQARLDHSLDDLEAGRLHDFNKTAAKLKVKHIPATRK